MDNKDVSQFLKRLEDKVFKVQKSHSEEVTDFLDPYMLSMGEDFLKNAMDTNYKAYGGVEGAERKRIVICPEYVENHSTMANISIVELTGNLNYITFNHSDCLGSLLGQGIKRERVGDIYPTSTGFVVALTQEIAQYILLNPPQLKGVTLKPQIHQAEEWHPPILPGKIISTTVPSLRLDTIVANGFGVSRTKVVSDIKGGKVRVNWKLIDNIAYQCKEKDVVSCRGRGRVVVIQVGGETRKGRIRVDLERYK